MSETPVAYRSFIGVDLHKCTVTLVAVAPDGTLLDRLKILYAMVRDDQPFTRGPATKHAQRANQARRARKRRKEAA